MSGQRQLKSLKLNMVLNAIKGLLSVLFPLITFPYVSKVLGVDNIGQYNFAASIISYVSLIAALGIRTYAVREGAKLRDSKSDFQYFASRIFTFNILTTVVSYLLLAVALLTINKLHAYFILIIILSVQVIFNTIGVEWIYTIYEDYAYITIRSLVVYILSLILLFAFVHNKDDLNVYAIITVIANGGANVFNFIHVRKYCKLNLTFKINAREFLEPVMILFATQLAVTIYTNSDTTILGFIWNDNIVGIYSVSTKIYTIIRTMLSSIIVVSIPRLAATLGKDNKDLFNETLKDVYTTLLTVIVPALLGIVLLRKEIILIISDETYIEATKSLVLLCVAMLFSLGAWFWGQCVLVPLNMESYVFKITMVSALINIGLNFVLIPYGKEVAAAFTTVVAEAFAFIMQRSRGVQNSTVRGIGKDGIKILIGCAGIVGVCSVFKFINNMYIYTIVVVVISVLVYGIIEIALKNSSVNGIIYLVKNKFSKNNGGV